MNADGAAMVRSQAPASHLIFVFSRLFLADIDGVKYADGRRFAQRSSSPSTSIQEQIEYVEATLSSCSSNTSTVASTKQSGRLEKDGVASTLDLHAVRSLEAGSLTNHTVQWPSLARSNSLRQGPSNRVLVDGSLRFCHSSSFPSAHRQPDVILSMMVDLRRFFGVEH